MEASRTLMEDDRLNSPSTSAIILDVLGHRLQLAQDPNSKHLGTTVWDASVVLIKFLERNSRKGRFCPARLKGKRTIELGAGCGLAGFGMALLGSDVVSTDQVEVLPLLMRNVERNTSYITQASSDSASFGSIKVAELDWGNNDHIRAVDPPFDFIIGTDIVYVEHLLEPLLQTILALSGPRTTILLGYEIRSTTVHEKMMRMWKENFEVESVPKVKMDIKYRHPSIQLFRMVPKAQPRHNMSVCIPCQVPETGHGCSEDEEGSRVEENEGIGSSSNVELAQPEHGKADDWETRRCGAMAARLLRDVKIT
ncbi:protein N-lysine methyltransferase METTL21A isoform X2 [Iris pallida]|uniref:Protein N-lysine methyltransferase METTL21A isoform X2 n=1 Tax=Iris pallida TaxID=29817 RepID=A0AAX6EH39_IRIPA|nr:protein N-lysine methyltransferase METTL21A isoform X2 [Iris pallida]